MSHLSIAKLRVTQALALAVLGAFSAQSETARADDTWTSWSAQNCDEVVELRAHGSDLAAPYTVPADREVQTRFVFDSTWGDKPVHALAFKPLVDNRRVTADFALSAADGSSAGAGRLLYDWFPGSDEIRWLGPNLGFALPDGKESLVLETHYYNQTQPAQSDRSGVAVCLARGESRLVAGVIDLGASSLQLPKNTPRHVVTRTCTYGGAQPVSLVNAAPGMHRLGIGFGLKVEKADGTPKVVIDREYRFGEREGVDFAGFLEQGDRITTTCAYNNSLPFEVSQGWRSDDEVCRISLTYYPEGALVCN